MARRKLLPIADLPLVGGSLGLDLANTTGARQSRTPRERLQTFADLVVWATRAGILDRPRATQLNQIALEQSLEAAAALEKARALREELYQLFRAIAEGTEPPPDALARLGQWWRAERSRRYLVSRDGAFELSLHVADDELDMMLWPIVSSAVELITSERIAHIKRCGECDWLFLDESKNGSRTWCKKECGDRARARRHYDRIRRGGSTQ